MHKINWTFLLNLEFLLVPAPMYDDKNCMPKENLTPNNLNDIDDNNKQ